MEKQFETFLESKGIEMNAPCSADTVIKAIAAFHEASEEVITNIFKTLLLASEDGGDVTIIPCTNEGIDVLQLTSPDAKLFKNLVDANTGQPSFYSS